MRTFPIERARELAREIFDQPHWKIEAARNRWPVSDLVTDVAGAIRAAAEEFGQSGGTIPEVIPGGPLKHPLFQSENPPLPPLPDRTGGIRGGAQASDPGFGSDRREFERLQTERLRGEPGDPLRGERCACGSIHIGPSAFTLMLEHSAAKGPR